MRVIEPSIEVKAFDADKMLKDITEYGQVCYASESINNPVSFVQRLIKRGHESVVEHGVITVIVICDIGVTHEIARHRIASYSQQSTRYCNYSDDKFGNEISVINPYKAFWTSSSGVMDGNKIKVWYDTLLVCERAYMKLIELGATPQEARSVLPNSLATKLVMTMNLREWRYFLRLRTKPDCHPQMRQIANMILEEFRKLIPVIVGDIP